MCRCKNGSVVTITLPIIIVINRRAITITCCTVPDKYLFQHYSGLEKIVPQLKYWWSWWSSRPHSIHSLVPHFPPRSVCIAIIYFHHLHHYQSNMIKELLLTRNHYLIILPLKCFITSSCLFYHVQGYNAIRSSFNANFFVYILLCGNNINYVM